MAQPIVLIEPEDATTAAGAAVSFSVVAFGEDPTTVQWFFNGKALADSADIKGVHEETLSLARVTASQSGSYTAVLTDPTGQASSRAAKLTVRGGTAPAASWTILVYGHGDHNLSQSLIEDLQEMEEAGSSAGFEIIVQADFNAAEPNRGLPPALATGVTRFRITQDSDPNLITSEVVERLPESKNMDDPQTLSDFLTWGFAKYPAQRHGLIFWDHGGQWVGFGGDSQDDTLQNRGTLRSGQIRETVAQAMALSGIPKLDFVSFDTCLMGGVEVLPDVVPLTDVYIACPEIDYGDGWNYGPTFKFLKANPGISALEFGRKEAEFWRAQHMQPGKVSDLNLAAHVVYDLTQYAHFLNQFNTFGARLKTSATPQNTWLPRLRLQAIDYSVSDVRDIGQPTDFVDLGQLADLISASESSEPELKTAARELVSAMDRLVAAKVLGTAKAAARGLSVYYPVAGSSAGGPYFDLTISKSQGAAWPSLLETVAQNRLLDASAPAIAVVNQATGTPDPIVTEVVLVASPSAPAKIRFAVTEGGDAAEYKASLVSNPLATDPSVFLFMGEVASGPLTGTGTQEFLWDTSIPVVYGAADGTAAPLGGFFLEPGSDTFVSFAVYSPPAGGNNQLVVLLTERMAGGELKIISALDAESNELAPVGIDLAPGGSLQPVYYVEQRTGPDPSKWESDILSSPDKLVIPAGGLSQMKVSSVPVDPGLFGIEVQVSDSYQNESRILNFRVRVEGGLPRLQIAQETGGNISVSWPGAPEGWILEATALLNPASWQKVDLAEAKTKDGTVTWFEAAGSGSKFYRLRRP